MANTLQITVDLPEEVAAWLGSPEQVTERLRLYAVLDLLRQKKISQGKAAELLQIDRHALFDLMAEFDIPFTDLTPEELDQDIAVALAATRSKTDR